VPSLTERLSGVRDWLLIGAVLAGGTLASRLLPLSAMQLNWQPALSAAQPWRAWTAAFVHYSGLHLAANLAGLALVLALGAAARLPRRSALAWLLAWPLTQLGLVLQPGLLHYGGLSGVLHAGAAVAGLHLVLADTGARRTVGATVIAGLVLKVLLEAPWAAPLRRIPGWDIAIAPMAHVSGLVAGLVCALLAHRLSSRAHAPASDG